MKKINKNLSVLAPLETQRVQRDRKKQTPQFLTGLEGRPINDLLLFGIFTVEANKETCTFERLVKECFTLFPKTFGFSRYRKWPDTRKLDWSLGRLRKKKLIKGNPKTFFTLTSQGRKEAQEIAKSLRQKKLL